MNLPHCTAAILAYIFAVGLPLAARAEEPQASRQSLDEAALTRRIEEYSDTKKGEERAAEDQQARAAIEEFVESFIRGDLEGMLPLTDLPWMDRAKVIRNGVDFKRRLAEFRVPASFAKGDQRIALLTSLEQLEQALGKKVPEAARTAWAVHLGEDSRIAIVQRGPMLIGFSLRTTESTYRVSGLLFDYFPRPDDPLLRTFSAALPLRMD